MQSKNLCQTCAKNLFLVMALVLPLSTQMMAAAFADSESGLMGVSRGYRGPTHEQIAARKERRRERTERNQSLRREQRNAHRGSHAYVHNYGAARRPNLHPHAQSPTVQR